MKNPSTTFKAIYKQFKKNLKNFYSERARKNDKNYEKKDKNDEILFHS